MCGRYYLAEESKKIYQRFSIKLPSKDIQLNFAPMFNIAPGSLVPVITSAEKTRVEIMKWGLIPRWAKDPRIGYKLINTRAESIAEKPSFATLFKKQRCLIPASGFYEWKNRETPYLITLKTQDVFCFAGIYDVWKDAENKEFKTFSIITTQPNKLVATIHDRMPVMLKKDEEMIWLDNNQSETTLVNMLTSYPASEVKGYLVSQKINNPRNQEADLIQPL